MKIAVGADERTHLTDQVIANLQQRGHELALYGPLQDQPAYWPAVAQAVAEAIASGAADEGVLFCWTGTGVSLAANKVPGIRAALCDDAETARGCGMTPTSSASHSAAPQKSKRAKFWTPGFSTATSPTK